MGPRQPCMLSNGVPGGAGVANVEVVSTRVDMLGARPQQTGTFADILADRPIPAVLGAGSHSRNAFGTPWKRPANMLPSVSIGLPATATSVEMPVGIVAPRGSVWSPAPTRPAHAAVVSLAATR